MCVYIHGKIILHAFEWEMSNVKTKEVALTRKTTTTTKRHHKT